MPRADLFMPTQPEIPFLCWLAHLVMAGLLCKKWLPLRWTVHIAHKSHRKLRSVIRIMIIVIIVMIQMSFAVFCFFSFSSSSSVFVLGGSKDDVGGDDGVASMLIASMVSQVKHEEVTGPEAEAAIAQITQQPPATPQEESRSDPHASKPTTSALAEHDAAFPAIGAMNGSAGPGKSPAAANGGASVVATLGDESAYAPGALDTLETAPSSVSVCLTVGDEGQDVLVALTLDGAQRYALLVLPCLALPQPALPFPALPYPARPLSVLPCFALPCPVHMAWPCLALPVPCCECWQSSSFAVCCVSYVCPLSVCVRACVRACVCVHAYVHSTPNKLLSIQLFSSSFCLTILFCCIQS